MMGGFLFLLYDSMVYKLYEDDVDQIEKETGKPVRELREEELTTAMKRLGIQKLEITPHDRDAIAQSKSPVKELSREEILAAMKRLGIQKLEVTCDDRQDIPKPIKGAMFCTFCGNALSSNARYCSRCGKERAEA